MSVVLERIRNLLCEEGAVFREVHHAPTRTSEEAARVRGMDIRIGGKALLMKVGTEFSLFVLSAALKIDGKRVRKRLRAHRSRFATREELHELTGLVPGCVPPFGEPVLPFRLYADTSVIENEQIAFNAGSLTDSVIMSIDDWQRIAAPEVFDLAKSQP